MENEHRMVVRVPEFISAYALREARSEGRRPSDVIGQLIRLGLETVEARKAEGEKARRIIESIKARV
jgi:RNase P/RNase MRP subunit p30